MNKRRSINPAALPAVGQPLGGGIFAGDYAPRCTQQQPREHRLQPAQRLIEAAGS